LLGEGLDIGSYVGYVQKMECPHCGKEIADEVIKSEGARLMVKSRNRTKEKEYAAGRAKIRALMEELQRLEQKYEGNTK
jgi:phage FluMu protein Com